MTLTTVTAGGFGSVTASTTTSGNVTVVTLTAGGAVTVTSAVNLSVLNSASITAGNNATLTLNADTDTIGSPPGSTVSGTGASVTILGTLSFGSGNSGYVIINTGDAADTVALWDGTNGATINAGTNGTVTINLNGGNDTVTVGNSTGGASISAGTASTGGTTLNGGNGEDNFYVRGTATTITTINGDAPGYEVYPNSKADVLHLDTGGLSGVSFTLIGIAAGYGSSTSGRSVFLTGVETGFVDASSSGGYDLIVDTDSSLLPDAFRLKNLNGAAANTITIKQEPNIPGRLGVFFNTLPVAGYSDQLSSSTIKSISILGSNQNDTLNVDLSELNVIGGGISFDGSTGTDDLNILSGTTTKITHNFTNASDGNVVFSGSNSGDINGTITYTNLEPVTSTVTAQTVDLVFNGGTETIAVSASGSQTMVDSTLSESFTFNNPSATLTIDAGTGNDTINVTGLGSGFAANLSITGGASGTDTINVNGAISTVGTIELIATNVNSSSSGTITATGGLTVDVTGTTGNMAGVIAGAGNLIKNGTGTLTLSAVNTFSGTTTINAGTLTLNQSGGNALPNSNAVTIVSGATLNLGKSETVGSVAGAGNITLNTFTLTTGDSTDTTLSGVISGTGALVKQGTGTFTLSGTNTYTGTTTVNAGTLTVSGTLYNGTTGAVNLANAGVTLNGTGTINGQVSVSASNNTNQTKIDAVTINVPSSGTGITVPAGVTFAQIGTTSGVTINGGGATSTGILVQGSAKIFDSTIQGQNTAADVNGGIAAFQGNTFTPGSSGTFITGLKIRGGAIVDAGQLPASYASLANGPTGNKGYYGDITGLFSGGTQLGTTGHSTGGNTFGTSASPFTLDTATSGAASPGPSGSQAIRNLNTGSRSLAFSGGVEQSASYGATGPLLGRMDVPAQENTWNGNSSLPIFQIEQLVYHDLDSNAVGFVSYGNSSAPAPSVVGNVGYMATTDSRVTNPAMVGSGTFAAGSTQSGQKSTIRFIEVTFSSYAFLDPNLQSPTTNRGVNLLQLNGPGYTGQPRLITVNIARSSYNRSNGQYTVTYSFSGAGIEYASLEDGNYSLKFNQAAIQGGGPGGPSLSASGDPFNTNAALFHRMFGDANGDRQVDNTDSAVFQASYRSRIGLAVYNSAFDYMNNGLVDSVSYYQFLRRYKLRMSADTGAVSNIP